MSSNRVQVEFPLVLAYLSLITIAAGIAVLFVTDSAVAYAVVLAVGFAVVMALVVRFALQSRREVERATVPGRPKPHVEVTLPAWAKRVATGYLVVFLGIHVIGAILLIAAAVERATE